MKQEVTTKAKIIGKFYAFTFDNQVLEFIVKDNHLMYCDTLSKELGITKLIIKPNFEVYFENRQAITLRSFPHEGNKNNLIGHYMISSELQEYLKENSLIEYTEEMAHFYNLDQKEEIIYQPEKNIKQKVRKKSIPNQ